MKEAAEVNKKRSDMHVEKRTRDKTIRDAMVRGRGARRARKGRGMGGYYLYLPVSHGISSSYFHCMCRMC